MRSTEGEAERRSTLVPNTGPEESISVGVASWSEVTSLAADQTPSTDPTTLYSYSCTVLASALYLSVYALCRKLNCTFARHNSMSGRSMLGTSRGSEVCPAVARLWMRAREDAFGLPALREAVRALEVACVRLRLRAEVVRGNASRLRPFVSPTPSWGRQLLTRGRRVHAPI